MKIQKTTQNVEIAWSEGLHNHSTDELHIQPGVFTARGYAKRGICRRRVSVTLRYCIKTSIRRITQTTPHDSPMILVF